MTKEPKLATVMLNTQYGVLKITDAFAKMVINSTTLDNVSFHNQLVEVELHTLMEHAHAQVEEHMTETDNNASAQIIPLMMLTDKDADHHADALNMLITITYAKDAAMDNSLITPDTDVPPE